MHYCFADFSKTLAQDSLTVYSIIFTDFSGRHLSKA
jgi:hypothetical protein